MTNKYEGHTKGPWEVRETALHDYQVWSCDNCVVCVDVISHKDTDLIADAPILLTENEQLREALAEVIVASYGIRPFKASRMVDIAVKALVKDEKK